MDCGLMVCVVVACGLNLPASFLVSGESGVPMAMQCVSMALLGVIIIVLAVAEERQSKDGERNEQASLCDVQSLSTTSREILQEMALLDQERSKSPLSMVRGPYRFKDSKMLEEYRSESVSKLRVRTCMGLIGHVVGMLFQRMMLLTPEHQYVLESLGGELTAAHRVLDAALSSHLAMQLVASVGLVLAIYLHRTRLAGVVLGVLIVVWLLLSFSLSRIWPSPQWLLLFPTLFSAPLFCVALFEYETFVHVFRFSILLWVLALAAARHLLSLGYVLRFAGSVMGTWCLNVWREETDRRRWRLHSIYETEIQRLQHILNDLLPLNVVQDAHAGPKRRGGGLGAGGGGSDLDLGLGLGNWSGGLGLHVRRNRSSKVMRHLQEHLRSVYDWHQLRAVVLQLDLVAYTELAQSISALEVAQMLHQIFGAFDFEVQKLDLFKMDTVGDAYIVAGWLPDQV